MSNGTQRGTSLSTTKPPERSGEATLTTTEETPAIHGPRLPFHPLVEERFGIDRASWKALVEVVFLGAQSVESVILALSYCKARKLDPFKRNVHIVPVWNKQLGRMVDTIWPGIGELRTTAFRTREYAGRGETVFGPDVSQKVGRLDITFPEWAQVTVRRLINGQAVDFCGPRVYWLETYATIKRDDDTPNEMWQSRPRGQIDKCAEAAALRAAFPEELGGEACADEINSFSRVTVEAAKAKPIASVEELAARLSGPVEEVAPPVPNLDDAFAHCKDAAAVEETAFDLSGTADATAISEAKERALARVRGGK